MTSASVVQKDKFSNGDFEASTLRELIGANGMLAEWTALMLSQSCDLYRIVAVAP